MCVEAKVFLISYYVFIGKILKSQLSKNVSHFFSHTFKDNNSFCGVFYGWGRKRSGLKAMALANKNAAKFVLFEDGFIRSLGLGVSGSPAFSIVEDDVGIFYDATVPSRLENLLNAFDPTAQAGLLIEARSAIDIIVQHHLSKYNHAPDVPVDYFSVDENRVLVVAQTAGDMSLKYGLGDTFSTEEMLSAAVAENPDSVVYLKVHPDVLSGKKQSDMNVTSLPDFIRVISEDFNPISLLKHFDKVYTKTSQMGFEALLLNKPVVCFGMPFYAGWGLTDDRVRCARRTATRSVQEVFAVAYLVYARYANPFTCEPYDLKQTLRFLKDTRLKLLAHSGDWFVFGVSKWKRRFVPAFLGFNAAVEFVEGLSAIPAGARVLVWAAYARPDVLAELRRKACQVVLLEDGFLRSVGLGINRAPPLSLVLDGQGMYYDATQSSDLEQILNAGRFDQACLQRAEVLMTRLVDLKLSKYNLSDQKLDRPWRALYDQLREHAVGKTIVLVPGQVESDASILKGSPWLKTNRDLLLEVRAALPDAFVIYKPHPDVLTGLRKGAIDSADEGLFDVLVTDLPVTELFEAVDEVHTLTSLTGFEALLRGKKVVCYGLPFYAGWGLTEDRLVCDRRTRKLSLAELVAGALIRYPTYVDPKTGHLIDVETAVTLLYQNKNQSKDFLPYYLRVLRWVRARFS